MNAGRLTRAALVRTLAAMTDQLSLVDEPALLSREAAVEKLAALVGEDLRPLADDFGITVWREGRRNKGWAGQVVERYLGQRPNSRQGADFGDWELKVVPMVQSADGSLRLKETMSITMFTQKELETCTFEESHLWAKLQRLLLVARLYESPEEANSFVLTVAPFDLAGSTFLEQVREDYEEIRWVAREHGVYALDARVGRLVQPRPKGGADRKAGHGFYARKDFVMHMLGL